MTNYGPLCGRGIHVNREQDARLVKIFNDGWRQFERTNTPYWMRFLVMHAAAEALGYYDTKTVLKNWLVGCERRAPGFIDAISKAAEGENLEDK